MKNRNIKAINKLQHSLALLCMLFSFSLQAQVDEEEKDSVKTGVDLGKLNLPNPVSILDKYTYDSASDRYIYTSSVDGFNIKYPMILTPKQYEELVLREQMRKYYQENRQQLMGKKQALKRQRRICCQDIM